MYTYSPTLSRPDRLPLLPSTTMDVHGLGALLHRLLTGRIPRAMGGHTDTTRPSLLVRSETDTHHRHYVPLKNDLDRVLLKALAEEPEQRYRSEGHTSELNSLMRISSAVFCLKKKK